MAVTKLKLKGHKLRTYWADVEDKSAHGSCECGTWRYRGWSSQMTSVRIAHQAHLRIVVATPVVTPKED